MGKYSQLCSWKDNNSMESNIDNAAYIYIRKATADDARDILNIYAPYVERTAITFDYDVPSLSEFQDRIKTISGAYPYIVAIAGGRIIGYAYAHQFKDRAAYQWSVESTIYLDMNVRHHGVGRLLYAELERLLRAQGILNMNACITYMDEPDEYLPLDSIHFHTTMGFTKCAHFHKSGYKFGKWYDMIWMEKMIGDHNPKK